MKKEKRLFCWGKKGFGENEMKMMGETKKKVIDEKLLSST